MHVELRKGAMKLELLYFFFSLLFLTVDQQPPWGSSAGLCREVVHLKPMGPKVALNQPGPALPALASMLPWSMLPTSSRFRCPACFFLSKTHLISTIPWKLITIVAHLITRIFLQYHTHTSCTSDILSKRWKLIAHPNLLLKIHLRVCNIHRYQDLNPGG